ncbi:MAG: type II secretion system protein [Nitrospirae bacterium]|nr:type II secretion system protein [Nitrospirota bacterium]
MKIKENKGFSLLELLVVIAVLSLLMAIAIPLLLGFRDKSRMAVFLRAAKESKADLQHWLDDAYNPSGRNLSPLVSVDCGSVTAGELLSVGVATKYAYCRNIVLHEQSPWTGDIPLWIVKNDVTGISSYTGQIVLVHKYNTSNSTWASSVHIYAIGLDGTVLYEDEAKY